MEENAIVEEIKKEEDLKAPKRVIKTSLVLLGIFILGLFLFGLGYFLGVGGPENIKQRLVDKDAPTRYKDVDFGRFWDALGKVEDVYIGSIDYDKMVDGAIYGMVSSLGDPFSVYLNKETLNEFNGEINGTFEGIGAELTARDGKLVIIAPLEGSPAEKAGMKAGDIIEAIEGQSVGGMTVEEAVMKIRGQKDSFVNLTIVRSGSDKPFDLKIKRETINVKSVDYKMEDNGIAYVKILRFDTTTKNLISDAADDINKNKAKGLILDLRNNPGGYLDSAIDVASEFIKEGTVVIEQYKDGKKEEFAAKGGGKLYDIPMVVLVNSGSASASEILAGAIHDHKRGALIGEKTFGKGSVQEMISLSAGGALKLTMAKWLTPSGTVIDKNGLLPDIEVKLEETSDVKKDNQLDRAREEVNKIIK
ncbi:MAG: S41 family peptidase [Patescibacteria group bacterium]|nr:S41 family peptidase [Patescibacteria group bacterium]